METAIGICYIEKKLVEDEINMDNLAREIYNCAHLEGEFRLRSGQISNEYFDKYLFETNPFMLSEISKRMTKLIPEEIDCLAGLEMGGIPLATAISLITNHDVLYVRKHAKEYGTCKLAEGKDFYGKRICIIEDVVTTGGQIIKSVQELRKYGAIIEDVICVIQREKKATEMLANKGLRLKALFGMEELKRSAERDG